MGLLDFLYEIQGHGQGVSEAARYKILQPLLDKAKAADLATNQKTAGQAYGKAATALGLNAPDIGYLSLLAQADPVAASQALNQAATARTPLGGAQLEQAQAAVENARLSGQSQRFQNLLSGVGAQSQAAMLPGQLRGQNLQNQLTQEQIDSSSQARDLALLKAGGPLGPGDPGFDGLIKARGAVQDLSSGIGVLTELIDGAGQFGSLDYASAPDLAGTMQGLVALMRPIGKALAGGGNLSDEDTKWIDKLANNPQDYFRTGRERERTMARLAEIRRELERKRNVYEPYRQDLGKDVFHIGTSRFAPGSSRTWEEVSPPPSPMTNPQLPGMGTFQPGGDTGWGH